MESEQPAWQADIQQAIAAAKKKGTNWETHPGYRSLRIVCPRCTHEMDAILYEVIGLRDLKDADVPTEIDCDCSEGHRDGSVATTIVAGCGYGRGLSISVTE